MVKGLFQDSRYLRLWTSSLVSGLGNQVTMLALPLTAALHLQASPTQMGLLTAIEILPFVLFSLPSGVLLDRHAKLPIYIGGELCMVVLLLGIPLAWYFGVLSLPLIYAVGFGCGLVFTVAGTAAQIVLTLVVSKERLVEAYSKNAIATSGAEVMGPGLAGLLIQWMGAPLALLMDAVMLLFAIFILQGIKLQEQLTPKSKQDFWGEMKVGLNFVRGHPILLEMAMLVGLWQLMANSALAIQILYALRELGLSAQLLAYTFVLLGLGSVLAAAIAPWANRRFGTGSVLLLGIALTGMGWVSVTLAHGHLRPEILFGNLLFFFSFGASLLFISFLSLRQALTPEPLLGRMTATMRWLILLPAGVGALLGGWLAENLGFHAAFHLAGWGCLLVAVFGILRGRMSRAAIHPYLGVSLHA